MMRRLWPLLALLTIPWAPPAALARELTALHSGTQDPAAEGWISFASGGTVATAPVTDGGVPAWEVADSGGGLLLYRFSSITPDQRHKSVVNGWRATARVRLPTPSDGIDQGAVLIALAALPDDTYRSFIVDLGTDAATNLLVEISGVSGVHTSSPGYHTLAIDYTAPSRTAAVRLDGATLTEHWAGEATGPGYWLTFGTFDFSVGTTRWSEVRYEIDDTPVVTNVTETGSGYRLNWLASTAHLSSLQVSSSAASNATWTTLGGCSGLVWQMNLCCTNKELQTQRFFRIQQYQP